MKRAMSLLMVGGLMACANAPAAEPELVLEGDPYGEPITLAAVTPLEQIVANPASFVGDTVLVEGTVGEVCEKKGCWMDVHSGSSEIQIKVEDDVIVFPLSSRGRIALVQGVVEAQELTAEQAFAAAAHRAEEQGEPFDSTAVFEPTTRYRIMGTGALIRDAAPSES